jgi:hypothetical protein
LVATDRHSRLAAAAATPLRFDIAVGHSERLRLKPTKRLLSILRERHKAVAKVTVALRNSGKAVKPAALLITVTP